MTIKLDGSTIRVNRACVEDRDIDSDGVHLILRVWVDGRDTTLRTGGMCPREADEFERRLNAANSIREENSVLSRLFFPEGGRKGR